MRTSLSYANVVSTLALTLAIGTGGAVAATKLIDGKTIRPGTVKARQLARGAVDTTKVKDRSLTATDFRRGTLKAGPAGPAGAVGPQGPQGPAGPQSFPAASGAVTGTYPNLGLAAGAVNGAAVANGSLSALDLGRFAGTLNITLSTVSATTCSVGTSTALTPIVAGQDLRDDAIVVTPPSGFPDATVTARPVGADQIRVTACAPVGSPPPTGAVVFRYVTFDTN